VGRWSPPTAGSARVRCAARQEVATRLRTDRTYRYPFTAAELWDRLQRVEAYTTWWPWLRDFDGRHLAAGEVWSCTVQPPLPYAVRFTVAFDDVDAGQRVDTTIGGDIAGTATLHLLEGDGNDAGGASALRLVADLSPRKRSMQALSTLARPLATFGHHWVLDTGARQFAEGLGGQSAG
jgi:hypothetical protein